MKERLARNAQARDERCEAMLERLRQEDGIHADAAHCIREHSALHDRKRRELYERWDAEVSQRVEHQLHKYMSKEPPELPPGFREELRHSDDPVKTSVRDMNSEQRFHRVA